MLRLMAWSVSLRYARVARLAKACWRDMLIRGRLLFGIKVPTCWAQSLRCFAHLFTISAYAQAACSEYEFQVALRWLCPRLAGRVIIMFVVPPADVKRHDNLEEPRLYSYRRIPLRSMSWKFDRELRPCGRKCALLFEGFKSSRR